MVGQNVWDTQNVSIMFDLKNMSISFLTIFYFRRIDKFNFRKIVVTGKLLNLGDGDGI